MATLTVTSATGTDTTSKVLTYSGPDAQKIFDAWTVQVWNQQFIGKASGSAVAPTHQDFTDWCGNYLASLFQKWNKGANTVTTPPPPIVIS